jgi:hypothetical protein
MHERQGRCRHGAAVYRGFGFGFRDSPIHPLQLLKDLRAVRLSAGLA